MFDDLGRPSCLIGCARDITELKRAERYRTSESRVLELVGSGAPLGEALLALAHACEEQAHGMRVSILLLQDGRVRHVAAPSLPEGWIREVDGQAIGPSRGSCGTAAYLGEPVIVTDVATDPRWADFREAALRYGLRACWSTPIKAREGAVLGTFALYYDRPRAPTAEHLALAERATHVAAIAIERQRAEDDLRNLNERLETRVRDRTAEIERRSSFQRLLLGISTRFVALAPREIDREIERALGEIATFCGADSAFLYRSSSEDPGGFSATHGWGSPDADSDTNLPLLVHAATMPWRTAEIQAGRLVALRTLDEMPPRAQAERALLASRGVVSFIDIPLRYAGEVVGFLGLAESSGPRAWEEGEITLLTLTGQIFTLALKRKEDEQALARAGVAAEAASQAKSVFLANMSHEIRTPMNAILGYTQLLQRDPTLSAQQRQRVESMGRSGEHLLGLINEVLEMSKIEAGRLHLASATFDLPKLIDDLARMFGHKAADKGLQFDVRADEVPRFVKGDHVKIRQILVNLLGNALKFTDAGELRLLVECRPEGDALLLRAEVVDTGPGIARAEQGLIFEKFGQTEAGRARGGTGLGLPLAREYTRFMGGDLEVDSEPGRGAAFRLSVLLARGAEGEVEAPPSPRRVIGLEVGQGPFRVVVADDDPDSRSVLSSLMADVGFEVREATNGAEAVLECERFSAHLVLMDLRMPVLDGYEATRRIQGSSFGRGVKVIAVSASAFPEDRAAAAANGAHGFVRKPFQEGEIFAAIEAALGARFDYAPAEGRPKREAAGVEPFPAGLVGALPAGLAADVRDAVLRGDRDALRDLLDETPGPPAFLDQLRRLAWDYDYERILTLLGDP